MEFIAETSQFALDEGMRENRYRVFLFHFALNLLHGRCFSDWAASGRHRSGAGYSRVLPSAGEGSRE
jgi:hypothetical protein